ncbi:MAG TPA: GNAT family N-acetyltransferase [Anaerolineales bacterium]|nr:GNAT family N-acetyltransferase [Anaerolineales bacterium]
MKSAYIIKIIENIDEMHKAVEIQRQVWHENETDLIPAHLMNSAVHSGGLLIGAFVEQEMVGFVFGFPGAYSTPDGPRLKHYSSILGVKPEWQSQGIGFTLKRAQWQMVRHQGIDRITWTFDPLLSRNAWLNITRLGAVCNTYLRDFYGKMQDGLNQGLPSDRFEVDWWVNSQRVNRRLSRRRRNALSLNHFLAGGAGVIQPMEVELQDDPHTHEISGMKLSKEQPFLLVEIPTDFMALKTVDIQLAARWRIHSRLVFERLFAAGYLVTDFVRSTTEPPRSYYVLCHGESTL